MLIMKKRIDLGRSPVVYDPSFSDAILAMDWQVRGGEWWV